MLMLNESDKIALLALARTTLESCLNHNPMPELDEANSALREKKGAFVSLHRGDDLRGCIGQLYPDQELYKVVRHCALSAALEDFRFMPVTKDELKELSIEISVLSPFRKIGRIEEIEVGRHGLYMVHGPKRGLLLPQVAVEYGWERETFLEQTCRKSGLTESAWQDPKTSIFIFEADIFSEHEKV
jgi:AmmeMemoRadiSam system protein A